jgi:hypothetical protein
MRLLLKPEADTAGFWMLRAFAVFTGMPGMTIWTTYVRLTRVTRWIPPEALNLR